MRIELSAGKSLRFLIAVILLGACSNGRTSQGPGSASRGAGDGKAVQILPEKPTAQDTLKVLHSGPARVIAYRWLLNNQPMEAEKSDMLAAGRFAKGDTVAVAVNADGVETVAAVKIENSPPRITSVPFADAGIYAGKDITLEPKAVDADGETVRFRTQWSINNEKQPEEGLTLPGTRFRKGDLISVTVVPVDSDGEGALYQLQPFSIPNGQPRFVSTPVSAFSESGYRYQARAEDPDGDPLVYSLASAPPGMTIDSRTGLVTWSLADARAGEQSVEITVRDADGLQVTQQYGLMVTLPKEGENEKR